jgi:hypothetical protein
MQITSITSLLFACAIAFGAGNAFAQDSEATGKSGKPLTGQQLRMKNCNADAREQGLKGDERRAFMSTCLKGGTKELAARGDTKPAATPSPAQLKRKACSAEAKSQGLKGDERKAFVNECVSEDELARAG